ncbi:MAG: hydrogenase maturation protease [Bacteroidales bacterium]|jgi:hydrogenase maturation protease|nr:hydrogenase maturation protease [Bacteroidales bacterium]
MKKHKILILGLGNILLQDEGIGVHALKKMTTMKWPEHVNLLDGGTGGFVLLSLFQDYQTMIIIDAALTNDPPGTVNTIQPKFAKDFPKSLSTHELGLKDMIESSILLGKVPSLYLITCTIHPEQEMSIELTPDIEKCIPVIVEEILRILKELQ